MAASDLAVLADVKTWLSGSSGIGSSDDALLGRLITDVSGAITAYLGRPSLTPRPVAERLDGNGKARMFLRHYPVLQLTSLAIDNVAVPAAVTPAAGAPFTKGYLLEAWDGLPPGRPQALDLFHVNFRRGRQNVVINYTAGYAVEGESATVPAAPGPYTVTATAPFGPWASDASVAYDNDTAMAAVSGTPGAGQYNVASGVYSFRGCRCRRRRADLLRLYSRRDQQCLHRVGRRTLSLPHPHRPERADGAGPDDGGLQLEEHARFRPRLARPVSQRRGDLARRNKVARGNPSRAQQHRVYWRELSSLDVKYQPGNGSPIPAGSAAGSSDCCSSVRIRMRRSSR